MKVKPSFDLSYCSNIHPGEHWDEHWAHLKRTLPQLKRVLAPNQKFGLGLRIGNQGSKDLMDASVMTSFKNWLKGNDLYVFTLNGFPYGSFSGQMVKENVHQPDWTTQERVNYTKRLFSILRELVQKGEEGSISTSPIGYKLDFKSSFEKNAAYESGANCLTDIIEYLLALEKDGYNFHLDLEPEPDGLLENSSDVINFFDNYLIPIASKRLKENEDRLKLGIRDTILNFIRICYDVCHFSVVFENQVDALNRLREKGIKIGKIQLSSALKIEVENNSSDVEIAVNKLMNFNEPVYLHQVAAKTIDNEVLRYPDLRGLLEEEVPMGIKEFRSHFHVPIFLKDYGGLSSTQNEISEVLNYLKKNNFCNHLEVETYTWDVLPKDLQMNVTSAIERELKWIISELD